MVSRSIVAFSWTHTVGILFVSWLYYKFFLDEELSQPSNIEDPVEDLSVIHL